MLVAKPLLNNLGGLLVVGRRCETSNSIKSSMIEQRLLVLVNLRACARRHAIGFVRSRLSLAQKNATLEDPGI